MTSTWFGWIACWGVLARSQLTIVFRSLCSPFPHLASKAQPPALLALRTQSLLILVVGPNEVDRAEPESARSNNKRRAVVQQLGAALGADDANVGAVVFGGELGYESAYKMYNIHNLNLRLQCSLIKLTCTYKQRVQVPTSAGCNLADLDHRLGALNHADDAQRGRPARLLLGRAECLDAGHDPLNVFRVVGLGQCDGFNVARAELERRSAPV